MAYALDLADEAVEDLEALLNSLPESRRRDALDGVEAALNKLAANPLLAIKQHLGRPTYRFQFVAGRVHYHWGATFAISEDEQRIIITHIFRVPM